jgi:anaerobic magnesium-protoporphyrin IX monomethyl ester cyclase
VNGRTFRSRPVEAVLDEISQQSARHAAKQVAFLDIKLNGDLAMWRGVADGFQRHLPGGTWVGTVHVQSRGDNGLSRDDLQAAYDSGMRRISCGLETGSQRVNDSMAKGTQLAQTSEFIRDAHAVGLSVRATMMLG